MGKIFENITPELRSWIEDQKMFFVATAPLDPGGHINLSPKGLDSFRIIAPGAVAYQDLTGSGIETIAHIRENKRIVLMFCAFQGPPKIIRLYGNGEVVLPGDERYRDLASSFPARTGARAIIVIYLTRIQDSCGYGVPLYDFIKDRDVLEKWSAAKGEAGVVAYQQQKNIKSMDGLKGIDPL